MKHYDEYDDDFNLKRYDVHDCPFCGSRDTDLYYDQVRCERCDAHGPEVSEEQWPLAITLWNELPRKQGEELKKLRSHWSNMMRRVNRAKKVAQKAQEKLRREQNAPIENRDREYAKWAADRAVWLARPINENDA